MPIESNSFLDIAHTDFRQHAQVLHPLADGGEESKTSAAATAGTGGIIQAHDYRGCVRQMAGALYGHPFATIGMFDCLE